MFNNDLEAAEYILIELGPKTVCFLASLLDIIGFFIVTAK